MMTSSTYEEAYVWIWLPDKTEPVVAGKLEADGGVLRFNYGKSYLDRAEDSNHPAISIFDEELPLQSGAIELKDGLSIPSCIRDAAPDAWGRRVIINKKLGTKGDQAADTELTVYAQQTSTYGPMGTRVFPWTGTFKVLKRVWFSDELTYLLESGSDRIGALDFQSSPTEYVPRQANNVSLEELIESAERVEQGVPLSPELDQALFHGSSIGGARPKALIEQDDTKYIAKFSSSDDLYSVVKAEFMAMRLAALCDLNVAGVSLVKAANKDVLLIERFDRVKAEDGWQRKAMVSALTLFGLDDMMARYASYEQLGEIIRKRFDDPKDTLRELYGRLVFNILCGNTDDHARNHAAFWNGTSLSLTPAYDICPQGRAGGEATQAMLIKGESRMSQISSCIEAAPHFLLNEKEALEIYQAQRQVIEENWESVCEEASLSEVDRNLLWGRQFLNPFAFEGLEAGR